MQGHQWDHYQGQSTQCSLQGSQREMRNGKEAAGLHSGRNNPKAQIITEPQPAAQILRIQITDKQQKLWGRWNSWSCSTASAGTQHT